MHSDKSKEQLRLASSLIDVDINEALQSFNEFKTECRVHEKENMLTDQRGWMNGMMKSVGLLERKLGSYCVNFINH